MVVKRIHILISLEIPTFYLACIDEGFHELKLSIFSLDPVQVFIKPSTCYLVRLVSLEFS